VVEELRIEMVRFVDRSYCLFAGRARVVVWRATGSRVTDLR